MRQTIQGPDCRIRCPGDKEACDGLGVCDENGQCQCNAPALGACVATPVLIGDGECMYDRKAYKTGGCRSKQTKDSCLISKAYGQNCCEWKCFSNTSSNGKCVQVDQTRPVECDLITDEAECSTWSTVKICAWKSENKTKNISTTSSHKNEVIETEVETIGDEEDDDIEVVDPDEEEALVATPIVESETEDRELERIMEDCKPKGQNLPHNSPLQLASLSVPMVLAK